MNMETGFEMLMVVVMIMALGWAGHEDYEAQLIMDDVSHQPVMVADGGAR